MLLERVLLFFALSIVFIDALDNDESCGRYHRNCGLNASCKNNKCVCNDNFKGAPLVECHPDDKLQCVVQSDPHMTTYENAKGNLYFPCRYRLTRIQTRLENATKGLAFCSFEVIGFNSIIDGRYFTSGMEISFAIGDFANHFFREEDIIKFDFNENGVNNTDGDGTEWGTGVHSSWNGIEVKCSFDQEERFATLDVPRCGVRISFRPFNPAEPKGPQTWVPAISMVVGKDTYFGANPLASYPASLCGEGGPYGDTEKLFNNRAHFLGVRDAGMALLSDSLGQNLRQVSFLPDFTDQVLMDKESCQEAVDFFTTCKDLGREVKAINICGRIMSKKRITKCMGIEALKAFNGCLEAVCGDKADGCIKVKDIFDLHSCKMPRKVKKFCKP